MYANYTTVTIIKVSLLIMIDYENFSLVIFFCLWFFCLSVCLFFNWHAQQKGLAFFF